MNTVHIFLLILLFFTSVAFVSILGVTVIKYIVYKYKQRDFIKDFLYINQVNNKGDSAK